MHISSFQHGKLQNVLEKKAISESIFLEQNGGKHEFMSWNETLSTQFLPGYRGNDMSQQFGVAFFFVSYMLCVGVVPWKRHMGTFFGFKLPRGFLRCWGISGACLRIYKVTHPPLLSITTYLPCFFSWTHIVQEFNGCRFCVFKVLNAIHCSLILKLPANYLKLLQ